MDSEFKPGDLVTWTSQASGSYKTKTGTIIRLIPKNKDAYAGMTISRGQQKGQRFNMVSERFLVQVPRGGKSQLSDYYTPRLEAIRHAVC